MHLQQYIEIPPFDQGIANVMPWLIIRDLQALITSALPHIASTHTINDEVAVHPTASIHPTAIITGPAIIAAGCFIGAHAVLRNGVWLGENVSVGAGVELKQSIICAHSAIAHFNFIGDSLIGSRVNFEAGAIAANHFNEREDKSITVCVKGERIPTGMLKFGALVGDNSKIGANAVLSPGTILEPGSVVARLELVSQS